MTVSVTSPRALRKASVPPRMAKVAAPPTSGNGATPPKMICPSSSKVAERRHCTRISRGGTATTVQNPEPVPTSSLCLSRNLTLLISWSPSLGLAISPVKSCCTISAVTWMRFDPAAAGVAVKANMRATSVRRRVMCAPPHREGYGWRSHHTPKGLQLRRCRASFLHRRLDGSPLGLQQHHDEPGRRRGAGVAPHDVHIGRTLVERLPCRERDGRLAFQLHDNLAFEHVDERMGVMPMDHVLCAWRIRHLKHAALLARGVREIDREQFLHVCGFGRDGCEHQECRQESVEVPVGFLHVVPFRIVVGPRYRSIDDSGFSVCMCARRAKDLPASSCQRARSLGVPRMQAQARACERRSHSSSPMRPRRASPNGTSECSSTRAPK